MQTTSVCDETKYYFIGHYWSIMEGVFNWTYIWKKSSCKYLERNAEINWRQTQNTNRILFHSKNQRCEPERNCYCRATVKNTDALNYYFSIGFLATKVLIPYKIFWVLFYKHRFSLAKDRKNVNSRKLSEKPEVELDKIWIDVSVLWPRHP